MKKTAENEGVNAQEPENSSPADAPVEAPRRPRRQTRRTQRRAFLVTALAGIPIVFLMLSHLFSRREIVVQIPPPVIPMAYAYLPSPNVDDRPSGAVINCIVLHSTVAPTIEETAAIFLDPKSKVSAHYVVGKNGRVVQMVPIERRAWHAGISELEGAPHVNDYSVGIEMVNRNDGIDPYPDAQIEAVAGIIRLLRSRFNIPDSRIVSHAQIALPFGRKSDPVGFDFDKVRALAR